jgi:hypothetical protein
MPTTDVTVDPNRIIGLTHLVKYYSLYTSPLHFRLYDLNWTVDHITKQKSSSAEENEPAPPQAQKPRYLATTSDLPLKVLYSQEIFSAFMWAAASKMKPLGGDTTLHADDLHWESFRLENTELSVLLRELENVSSRCLGSMEDVLLSIGLPLSYYQKLPDPSSVLQHASTIGTIYESEGDWEGAAHAFVWLSQLCKGLPFEFQVRGTVALMVFTEFAKATQKHLQGQVPPGADVYGELKEINEAVSKALRELETAESGLLEALLPLAMPIKKSGQYEIAIEGVDITFKFAKIRGVSRLHCPFRHEDEGDELIKRQSNLALVAKDILGFTPVHYWVMLETPLNAHERGLADTLGKIPWYSP